jgi:hypothetical protein
MMTVEFRDLDGSYVLARRVDDVRCRVLASNVMAEGRVLYKNPRMSWEEAGRDLGGFTRLIPLDFEGEGTAAPSPDAEGPLSFLEEKDLLPSRHMASDASELSAFPLDLMDPEEGTLERLARLTMHYVKAHRPQGLKGSARACRCPGFRPNSSLPSDRLQALVGLVLAARSRRDLGRIRRAVRRIAGRGVSAA